MRLVDSIRWSLCCESISLPLWQPSPSSRGTTLPNSAGRSSWVAPGSNPKHNICTLYLNCDVKSTKTKDFVIGIFLFYLLALVLFGLLLVDVNPDDREAGDVEVVAVGVSDVSACHEIWGGCCCCRRCNRFHPPGLSSSLRMCGRKEIELHCKQGLICYPGIHFLLIFVAPPML